MNISGFYGVGFQGKVKKSVAIVMINVAVSLSVLIGLVGPVRADSGRAWSIDHELLPLPDLAVNAKPYGQKRSGHRSWALALDNDILVPSSRDQDYTYGVSATYTGASTKEAFLSLHGPLQWVDRSLGRFLGRGSKALSDNSVELSLSDFQYETHSVELGLYGFTPEDILNNNADQNDRPYASLLYVSSSKEIRSYISDVSWRSTLTFGVLGLDLVGDLQNEVHKATGSDRARGWSNQISDGGELTARYSVARQRLWSTGNPNLELKSVAQGSVGYLTEASWGLSLRVGRLATPWQSFNPALTSYRENATDTTALGGHDENYFLLGFALKARAYNVFLQGQFRDSAVTYRSSELRHGIAEAWLGYSYSFKGGYRASYILRGHTSEVESGRGDRNVLWGGLTLSKTF